MSLTRAPSGLVLSDCSTQGRWALESVDRSLVELLQFCVDWRELDEVVAVLVASATCDHQVARATVHSLVESGLLLREGEHPEVPPRAAFERWARKGWGEAFLFHARTNLLPKTDYSTPDAYRDDIAAMRRKVEAEPHPPSNYKQYPHAESIALPWPAEPGWHDERPLESLLSEEPAECVERRLGFEELAWFIRLAYGQTAERYLPVSGHHVGKTSPSGGSRHPTEVYPIVFDVESIEAGLYHYDVQHNRLEVLQLGNLREQVRTHLFLSLERPPFRPRVVFVYATLFERSMFRYREPRSYRVMHLDLGHLMQTSAYLAAAVRRPCYRAYAMHDSQVDRLLGIDGISESAMAFTALG